MDVSDFEFAVHHPSAWEDGLFVVRIHRKGTKWVDANIEQLELTARSESDALKKAKAYIKNKDTDFGG